jgi:hypothetical protein
MTEPSMQLDQFLVEFFLLAWRQILTITIRELDEIDAEPTGSVG